MIKKPIKIRLSSGLEARPVAMLVQVASQYESEIYVESGRKKVNAKSIMGMMTLGLDNGEEVTVTANGKDESEAMDGVEKYLSSPSADFHRTALRSLSPWRGSSHSSSETFPGLPSVLFSYVYSHRICNAPSWPDSRSPVHF